MKTDTKRHTTRYAAIATTMFLPLCVLFFLSCIKSTDLPVDDFNTWTLSGYVIDGYTEKPMSNVSIFYRLEDGLETIVSTSPTGNFYINDLPFGEKNFRFSYTNPNSATSHYTEKLLVVSNWSGMNAPEGELGDASKIIRLYPLNGSLSGNVIIKLRESEQTVPAESALVRITFNDTGLHNSTPSLFETFTDSTGSFKFDTLPLASGLQVSVRDVMINNLAYSTEDVEITHLSAGKTISTGSIYMQTKDTTDLFINAVTSNVISKDGFGLTGIPVDATLWYVLSIVPDSSNLNATIEGGGNPNALVQVSKDTVFINPTQNFTFNDTITVTIRGKDIEGNRFELHFNDKKQFITEQGVVAVKSNMWDNAGEPISSFSLTDTLWIQFSEMLDTTISAIKWYDSEADINLFGYGSKANADFRINKDTLFVKPNLGLNPDSGQTIGFKISVSSGNARWSNPTDYTVKLTESDRYSIVASNVLLDDGFGLTGVPVDITPYYVLAVSPDSSSIEVAVTGGGDPDVVTTINGDTIFVNPVKNFTYNELVTVTITGKDIDGNRIFLNINEAKRFKTEQGMFPVASNTWDVSGNRARNFNLYDTMWVVYSKFLDTNILLIEWSDSEADNNIYGSGPKKNAEVFINKDTLFILPDLRLAVDFGQTTGFNISVQSVDKKRSQTEDFVVQLVESSYYITWTNTKDQFGKMRDDFNVMDTVILVSSIPISTITAISEITDAASDNADAISPPDMTLDNIILKNDTIFYIPGIRLEPDTRYGMDFDITFLNGMKRSDVLPVTWQTSVGTNITSVNNREGGSFRPFSATGDSLIVIFSKAVDTGNTAQVPFAVNCSDINGIKLTTFVKWNTTQNRAVITFMDTLPLADYNASPAYTTKSANTRSIDSVTFNLTTTDGELVFKLGPKNETIEIHTEAGLCPLSSTIIAQNNKNNEVTGSETPVIDFAVTNDISVTFNRMLDTSLMQLYGASLYAGIESKESGLQLPCAVTFSADRKSLIINPAQNLDIGKEYFVWIKDVPGYAIGGAAAINKHSGTFSGNGTNNRLLTKAFRTASPDIRALQVIIAPDTSTVAGVTEKRLGVSSGFSYSSVVGTDNINTESSIKFRIHEAAWHTSHSDSVSGYQVQVQRVDRSGNATNWYDHNENIETIKWNAGLAVVNYSREVSIRLTSAPYYSSFLTKDNDGAGSFYLNSSSLFNDSSRINIRVRPYIGTGDAGRNEVGRWSDTISIIDNVAPCDSDFVTAANVNSLAKGGVQVIENIDFDNSGGSVINNNGYIDITFPEDMDPNGPEPQISFYYGPFDTSTTVSAALSTLPQSNWITARKYRAFISVPVFDFTHSSSNSGAYYNVSVAGCRDASGNTIKSYGTDGILASNDITAIGRPIRTAAAAVQVQGSSSIINGFMRCD